MIIPDIRRFSNKQLEKYVGLCLGMYKGNQYPSMVYGTDKVYHKNFKKPMLFKDKKEAKRILGSTHNWMIIKLEDAYIYTRSDLMKLYPSEKEKQRRVVPKAPIVKIIKKPEDIPQFKPDMKKVDAFLKYKEQERKFLDGVGNIRTQVSIFKEPVFNIPVVIPESKPKTCKPAFKIVDKLIKYVVKDNYSGRWVKLPIDQPFLTKYKSKATVMRKEKCQEVIDELEHLNCFEKYSKLKLSIEEV